MKPVRRGWVEPGRRGGWILGGGAPGRMGGWILGGGAPGRRGRGAPGIGIEDDDTDSDSNLAKGIYVLLFDFHLVGTFPKRLIFLDGESFYY
jgi:hypothetical protein